MALSLLRCPGLQLCHNQRVLAVLQTLTFLAASSQLAAQPPGRNQYKLTDLGSLGGNSEAVAINDAGDIVGTSFTRVQDVPHAFLWQRGRIADLGSLGGGTSYATAINANSQVIGWYTPATTVFVCNPQSNCSNGSVWQAGTTSDLSVFLGGTSHLDSTNPTAIVAYDDQCFASDINTAGNMVGGCGTAPCGYPPCSPGGWPPGGFVWRAGQFIHLGTFGGRGTSPVAINDRDQIVGRYFPSSTSRAFFWANGTLTDLGEWSPTDINTNGVVVGTGSDGGILWQNGMIRDLGSGAPLHINDRGEIVGVVSISTEGDDIQHATIYDSMAGAWLDLNELVALPRKWVLREARDINDLGEIVGVATVEGGRDRAFLLTPTGASDCTFTISPVSTNFDAGGGADAIDVTAGTGCSWSAGSNVSWISVTAFDGVGTGKVRYSVDSTTASRTGTIVVAGFIFTVIQHGPTVHYYGLGDSVASGHGLSGDVGVGCRQTPGAYPNAVADRIDASVILSGQFACSGATSGDLPAQVTGVVNDFLNKKATNPAATAFASITIGANDLQWSSPARLVQLLCATDESFEAQKAAIMLDLRNHVHSGVERLVNQSVRVILTEYHNPFNPIGSAILSLVLAAPSPPFPDDCRMRYPLGVFQPGGLTELYNRTEDLTATLNGTLLDVARAFDRKQVRIAPVYWDFRKYHSARPICGGGPPSEADTWIQVPRVGPTLVDFFECFHPNSIGAQHYADAVAKVGRQILR